MAERDAQISSVEVPRILNAQQLASYLGVPVSWVREKARTGDIPRLKIGHYVRFRLDDVQTYLSRPTGEA
jgi:excisionase family DNA binding protein